MVGKPKPARGVEMKASKHRAEIQGAGKRPSTLYCIQGIYQVHIKYTLEYNAININVQVLCECKFLFF